MDTIERKAYERTVSEASAQFHQLMIKGDKFTMVRLV